MIPPSDYNPAAAQHLLQYLEYEIFQALGERRPLEEQWLKWLQLYKAIPEVAIRQFPFYGASNIVLPIVATDVDTVFSRLMGIVFAPENVFSTRARRPDAVEWAPRLQEFLKAVQDTELGVYDSTANFMQDLCKLGTGVLKQRYQREQKLVYEFREIPGMGALQRFNSVQTKNHPVQQHVSLWDFVVPATATADLQKAPWCAERLLLTPEQYAQRVKAGIYGGWDRISAWAAQDRGSWLLREMQRMDRYVPGTPRMLEFWEFWLDYDIRGTGEPVSVLCTIHRPTNTYLRIDYNPFFHQEKPYSAARYLRNGDRFYGIGLAEMNASFQEEVTTMHRQRLDNATLANTTMMKARKGIGIKEDEPIMPGRWMLMDDPQTDVLPMQIGQRYDSTVPYEQLTMTYAQRRSGVNDYVMGSSDNASIGYGAAYTNVMQHKEAAKRFDQTLREVRKALGESGQRCVELYQQFDPGGRVYEIMGPEDGAVVMDVLHFPLELIRNSVLVQVTASSATLNKDVEIRTNTILMQQVTQFYAQLMQGMALAMNPQLPPILQQLAAQMVVGGVTLMRRLLDSYEVQDIDTIIPRVENILYGQQQQLAQLQAQFAQQIPGGTGGGGFAGVGAQPGMAPGGPGGF